MSGERLLVEQVAELRERLAVASALNTHRLHDVRRLTSKLGALIPGISVAPSLSEDARLLLYNISAPGALRLPSIYSYLPHLLRDPFSTTPAYILSKDRTGVSLVLGVPTVKREVQSYLMTTLQNLINGMTEKERNDSLIVVFVAEADLAYVNKVASLIERNLSPHLQSGLIDVISPSASYYPDLTDPKLTLGDPVERVRWRTKQNLDFAFLMMYAQGRGTFYVQLEDDVQAKQGYVSTMLRFALQNSANNKNWFVLDFCQLGFIGKMFKCAELPYLVQFFLMFFNDKPVDWLLDYLVQTKSCNLDKDSKDCKAAKDKVWIRFKPSLFQHIGTHSSLKGKVQKLKDKQFGKVALHFPHLNPTASVETNIKAYKSYTFDRAYRGETFFWGLLPQQGDHLTIAFSQPTVLTSVLFRSGNAEHPSDRLYNTTVEVLPVSITEASKAIYTASDLPHYLVVGRFDDMGICDVKLSSALGAISVVKLRVHAESDNWAILSEIFLRTSEDKR